MNGILIRKSKYVDLVLNKIKNKKTFNAYDVAKEICKDKNIEFWSEEGNNIRVMVSYVFRRLRESEKIKLVREEQGQAPAKRKIYGW